MESEWSELLLDPQFETDRTGVANQPDISVLKEGSWFDVKKHDKLIKHFDGMHMSTRAPRRSQLDGWLRDSKQSWTLHGTKLPYKVPYNEGWSRGTRLNSEQYRKCKNFTKHNTVAELQQETSTYRAGQLWTYWLKLKLNFKKLYVSVLPDAWIDLYFTKKTPLFMAKVKHFSVKRPICMFIVCTSSHNRDNFCCICSGVPCACTNIQN